MRGGEDLPHFEPEVSALSPLRELGKTGLIFARASETFSHVCAIQEARAALHAEQVPRRSLWSFGDVDCEMASSRSGGGGGGGFSEMRWALGCAYTCVYVHPADRSFMGGVACTHLVHEGPKNIKRKK